MADRALYLDVSIQTDNYIDIAIASNQTALDFTIEGSSESRLPYYEGSYEVDPRKIQQILETANKSMENDVVINPIFYSEVENPAGGNTVYIGME